MGEKIEAVPQRKPLVTRASGDFGVGSGARTLPGELASDLDYVLPLGKPPHLPAPASHPQVAIVGSLLQLEKWRF